MNRQAHDSGSTTGALGSTETTTVPIRTDDGDLFRAEVYETVDVSRNPELGEQLFDGSLNEVEDPSGRATYRPAVAVRYHDPDKRIFALVVPEPLRHRTLQLRRELLAELDRADGHVPDYVANFTVAVSPSDVGELAGAEPSRPTADREGASEELARIEKEREELERRREELEREQQSLKAQRLNLEEKSRKLEKAGGDDSYPESTQVVTDDQFISVAPQQKSSEEGAGGELAGASSPGSAAPERALDLHVASIELDAVPSSFDDDRAGGSDGYVEVSGGRVRACGRMPEERLEAYRGRSPRIFAQRHRVEGVPVAALTIGLLDEDDQPVDTFGWPLDPTDDVHQSVLHRLSEDFALDVALYDEEGAVETAWELHGPFEENVEWIRERLDAELDESEMPEEFSEIVRAFQADDFERVGRMRHNFEREAFHLLDTPSRVKLAAGVVGYWSSDDQIEYLLSNRTYPVLLFRELQDDVVEAAIEYGIFLPEPLRERAVELGAVTDEIDLVERQLANFAEVGVQLRENDLDPVDEWENWDELIELAKAVGVTPDPDVLELAESSLQRAKDYQETHQKQTDSSEAVRAGGSDEGRDMSATEEPSVAEAEELVVGKRSEKTGVTYYLPDDAVLDTFDDLADMSQEDLEKLLDDPNGRLEAAQMLVERFDSDVVPMVLEAAEQMSAPELTALARFLETKADALEPELVRAVESGGPSATFVAARALAEIRSTTALPKLLEAYRDPDRQLNRQAVGRTLASYGEKFVPELTSSIEEDGVDDEIVTLLMFLAEQEDGILEQLGDHRSEEVREAAERARDQKL